MVTRDSGLADRAEPVVLKGNQPLGLLPLPQIATGCLRVPSPESRAPVL